MRILFVDDCPERTKQFRERAAEHELVCVEDCKKAVAALDGEPFDMIFLDHDLADEHYWRDMRKGTGTEIAQRIAAKARKHQHATIILHSLNHAGRQRMRSILGAVHIKAIDAPWGWLRSPAEYQSRTAPKSYD